MDKLLKMQHCATCIDCLLFLSLSLCLPEWEIYKRVQFIPHITAVGEALQMDHQHRWQRPQVKLLGGLLVLLTVRTVPVNAHMHDTLANAAEHKHILADSRPYALRDKSFSPWVLRSQFFLCGK